MTVTYTNLKITSSGGGGGFYSFVREASVSDDNVSGASSITANFNTDGSVSFTTSIGDGGSLATDLTHWHDGGTVAGIGNSRWAKKTFVSGDITAGSLATTITDLTAVRTIAIQTVAGEARSGVVLIEIYSDAGGTTKVGEISFTITASIP